MRMDVCNNYFIAHLLENFEKLLRFGEVSTMSLKTSFYICLCSKRKMTSATSTKVGRYSPLQAMH